MPACQHAAAQGYRRHCRQGLPQRSACHARPCPRGAVQHVTPWCVRLQGVPGGGEPSGPAAHRGRAREALPAQPAAPARRPAPPPHRGMPACLCPGLIHACAGRSAAWAWQRHPFVRITNGASACLSAESLFAALCRSALSGHQETAWRSSASDLPRCAVEETRMRYSQ